MLMRPTVFWTWQQEVGTNGVQTMLSAFLLSQVFLVTLFMSKMYMEKKQTHIAAHKLQDSNSGNLLCQLSWEQVCLKCYSFYVAIN